MAAITRSMAAVIDIHQCCTIIFTPLPTSAGSTAVAFPPRGDQLLFGGDQLSSYDLSTREVTQLPSPMIPPADTIAFIAANPEEPEEIAFATVERNIYRWIDDDESWKQIAREGVGL